MAREFDEHEEVFRNVSELKRRMYNTEVSLQRMQTPRHSSLTESDSQDVLSLLSMRDLDEYSRSAAERQSSGEHSSHQKNSQSKYRQSRSWSKSSKPNTPESRDVDDLMDRLHRLRRDNSLLAKENNRLKNEVEASNKALKSSHAQMIQHLDDADILKEQITSLKTSLKEKDKDLRSVERELERSLSEQQQWEDVINESRVEAGNIRDDLKAEIAARERFLERELARSLLEQQWKDTINESRAVAGNIRDDLKSQIEARERLEKENGEVKRLLDSKEHEMKSFRDSMVQQIKKHEDTEMHLQTSLRHCDKERAELLDRATMLEGELQNAREEVRNLKRKLASSIGVQTISKELKEVIRGQERHVLELRGRLEGAERENQELREQNEQQKRQLMQKDEKRKEDRQINEQRQRFPSTTSESSLSTISHTAPAHDKHFFLTPESARLDGVGAETRQGDHPGEIEETTGKRSPRTAAAELRMKQAIKNAELQREQAQWQQRSAGLSPEQGIMDGLRAELFAIVEQSKIDSRKTSRLEEIISKLDEERKGQAKKLCRLHNQLDEVMEEKSALARQWELRDSHFVQIKKDMEEKASKLSDLNQELQRKDMQLISLESQLDKTTSDFQQQLASLSGVESKLTEKTQECEQLQRQFSKTSQLLDEELKKFAEEKSIHNEQCSELQHHVNQLQGEINNLKTHLEDSNSKVQNSQQQVTEKTVRIGQLEAELHQTQIILQQKDAEFNLSRQTLERQMKEGWSKSSQLETALVICKEEMSNYVKRLEQAREKNELEMATKSHEVLKLEKQLQHSTNETEEKTRQMNSLERALDERQSMLLQSNKRIADLEEREGQLEQQVSQFEREVSKLRAESMKASEDLQSRLNHTKRQLTDKTLQFQELNKDHSKLKSELQQFKKKLTSVEREAYTHQEEKASHIEEMSRLQQNLEAATNDLMGKVNKVSELEKIIHDKDTKILEKQEHTRELDVKLNRAWGELQEASRQLTELQHLLQMSRSEVKEKKETISELEEDLKQSRSEVKSKENDLLEMEAVLRSSHAELEERTKQVNQFDHVVKEHKLTVETRAKELEDKLDQSKEKIQRQIEQISTLEQRCFEQVQELQRQSFHKQGVESDLKTRTAELAAQNKRTASLEQEVQRLKAQLSDKERDHGSQSQELNTLQQQYQQANKEQAKLRKELMDAHHEMEQLAKQLEEVAKICQSKDAECTRLAKQLGESKAREVTVQSHLTSEMTKVAQQQNYELEQKEQELADLQREHFQILTTKDQQQAELNCLRDSEQKLRRQLRTLEDTGSKIQAELRAKDEMLQAANEAAVIKEAECARLSAQISGYERALLKRSNTHDLSPLSKVTSALSTPVKSTSGASTPSRVGHFQSLHEEPYTNDQQLLNTSTNYPTSPGTFPNLQRTDPSLQRTNLTSERTDLTLQRTVAYTNPPLATSTGLNSHSQEGRYQEDFKKPFEMQELSDKVEQNPNIGSLSRGTDNQFVRPSRDSVEGLNISSFQDMLAYVNRKIYEDEKGGSRMMRAFSSSVQGGMQGDIRGFPSDSRLHQVERDNPVNSDGRRELSHSFSHDDSHDSRGLPNNSNDVLDTSRGFPGRRGFPEGQPNRDTSQSLPSSTEKQQKHVTYKSDSTGLTKTAIRASDVRGIPASRNSDVRGFPRQAVQSEHGRGNTSATSSEQLSSLGNTMPFISSLLANTVESPNSGSDRAGRTWFPKGADSPESEVLTSDYEDTLVKRFSSSLNGEPTAFDADQRSRDSSTTKEPGKKAVNRSLFDGRQKQGKSSGTNKTRGKIPKR